MAPCIKVDSCHEEGLEWIAGSFENRVWVPEGDLLLELVSDLVVARNRINFLEDHERESYLICNLIEDHGGSYLV